MPRFLSRAVLAALLLTAVSPRAHAKASGPAADKDSVWQVFGEGKKPPVEDGRADQDLVFQHATLHERVETEGHGSRKHLQRHQLAPVKQRYQSGNGDARDLEPALTRHQLLHGPATAERDTLLGISWLVGHGRLLLSR